MKSKETNNRKPGKYQSQRPAKRRRRRNPLIFLLTGIVLLLLLAIGIMLNMVREQKAFEDLAAMVQAAETTCAPTASGTATGQTAPETTVPEMTEPVSTVPEEPHILEQYAQLYERNSELYGWLKIEGTKIDYPVMYTPQEPEKYLHRDFEGKDSYGGVPFLEEECSPDSDNLIIYGHNMANGTMFRDLIQYEQEAFWKEHPQIRFDTLYEEQTYEVVAAFYDRVYRKSEDVFKFYQFIDAGDQADFDDAVGQFREKAIYDTGVVPRYGDQLITLVTCAYHTENGRFVVVARRIPESSV